VKDKDKDKDKEYVCGFYKDDIKIEIYRKEYMGYIVRGYDEKFGYEIEVTHHEMQYFDKLIDNMLEKIIEDIKEARNIENES